MDLALSTIDSREYSATEFERATNRDALKPGLICPGCRADAYFIRRARNGRQACFGARPHNRGCRLGADGTDDRGTRHLPEAEQRDPIAGEFNLQPMRDKKVAHVRHEEGDDPDSGGRGRRHTLPRENGTSRPDRDLSRLLRELVRVPGYRDSRDVLHLDNGTRTTVREWCVHSSDAGLDLRRQKRLYWGTIRYVGGSGENAWFLNTGRGEAPTLVLQPAGMERLLKRKRISDVEDLEGASFITHSKLGYSNKNDSPRFWLHIEDLDWFTVRLPHQDPEP